MRHYTQLTIEQRYQISGLRKAGFNQSEIATDLNIHTSTISRKLKRNVSGDGDLDRRRKRSQWEDSYRMFWRRSIST